jgi:hypothetical protein
MALRSVLIILFTLPVVWVVLRGIHATSVMERGASNENESADVRDTVHYVLYGVDLDDSGRPSSTTRNFGVVHAEGVFARVLAANAAFTFVAFLLGVVVGVLLCQ